MISITSAEAQNRFGQLLEMAQREPVAITRHGRTSGYVVSPQDMQLLLNARAQRSAAVQEFETLFARLDTQTAETPSLTDADVVKLVHALR